MNRLEIDWTRCQGHGLCAAVFPAQISLDEWGYPLLPSRVLRPVEIAEARRAVALCPSLALRLAAGAEPDRRVSPERP